MQMFKLFRHAAAASLLVLTSASWAGHCGGDHKHDMAAEAKPTIVEVATGNEDFSTLVAALQAAGLVDVLAGDLSRGAWCGIRSGCQQAGQHHHGAG